MIYPPTFIEDGYTRTVTINGKDHQHGPVTFTYRPFVGGESHELFQEAFASEEGDTSKLYEMLAERIRDWDLELIPASQNLARLNGLMFDKILKVVLGMAAPDGEESDQDQAEDDAGN